MPMYTYRREDGSTFEIRQKFLDDPLDVCPATGQKVVRVVQPTGIIFKGSGFYVTDNKAARSSASTTSTSDHDKANDKTHGKTNGASENKATDSTPSESKASASKPASVPESKASSV